MAWFDSPKNGVGSLGRCARIHFVSVAAAVMSFSSPSFAEPDKATVLGYGTYALIDSLSFVTIGDDHWCIARMGSESDPASVRKISMVTKSGKNKLEIAPFPDSKSFIVGSKSKMACDFLQQRQSDAKSRAISIFASASTVALPYLVQVAGSPLMLGWLGKGAVTSGSLFKATQEAGMGVFHPIVFVN